MAILTAEEARFCRAVSKLTRCNPFSAKWGELEKEALGSEYVELQTVHGWHEEQQGEHPNLALLERKVFALSDRLHGGLVAQAQGAPAAKTRETSWYASLILYRLYRKYRCGLEGLMGSQGERRTSLSAVWEGFAADYDHYLPSGRFPARIPPEHLLACFFQIRRAFTHVFSRILGASKPAIGLRAAVWESIFTRDLRQYIESDYRKMPELTTLIVGPSGTGKELVAQAIGLSQYIPLAADRQHFLVDPNDGFRAVNLSALAPTLMESELFGHCRGAFTGATEDRVGWLGECGEHTTLFFDEIGDLDGNLQIKLLRVLETRQYQRVGETLLRRFQGRIVAATNRNLAREMSARRFRPDFYYRLCANLIRTPSLHSQLADRYEDLDDLVDFILRTKLAPSNGAADRRDESLRRRTERVRGWIDEHLTKDYPWPGNVRELEQCIRSLWLRGRYRPARCVKRHPFTRARQTLAAVARLAAGRAWTEKELLDVYHRLVYEAQGSNYQAAAEVLGVGWRSVRSRVRGHAPR